MQAQAERVVLSLLAHPLPAVQLSAFSLMETLLDKVGRGGRAHGAFGVQVRA